MPAIDVQNLHKSFRTKRKAAGFQGSFRSLWRPEWQTVEAVRAISSYCCWMSRRSGWMSWRNNAFATRSSA